jgi:RNA polymerase sigma-70 factor (ECF subfamily)
MLSDEALYERMLAGDLSAFDALYERYERRLLGFIRGLLRDAAEAEDVLHDAFLALLREGKAGRSATSFRPWIFQTARNLCLNRLRTRTRATRAVASAEPPAPLEAPGLAIEARQAADRVSAAVATLPGDLAELFRLRASGLSYEQLSDVLAIPLGTVKSRMHEMVHRLREEVRK